MKAIAVIAILLNAVSAWWDHGHLLTALIAEKLLLQDDDGTHDQIINILETLKIADPKWTQSEDKHPMVECATFADEIKSKGGSWQSGWHFIDEPFLDEGGKISDYNFTFDSHNVTEVINALNMWHNKADGYQETFEYQTIMQHTYKDHSEENGLSYALRFLIHYVGDVHQPLHATTRVDHQYERGDFGGNLVYLPDKDHLGAKNLHAVWDSVIYKFTGRAKLPFNDADWTAIAKDADDLMARYKDNITDAQATNLDVKVWAHESFLLSEDTVYPTVEKNQPLSDEYLAKASAVAERQVVLGGYRLYHLLKSFHLKGHESHKKQEESIMMWAYRRLLNAIKPKADEKHKMTEQEKKKCEEDTKKAKKDSKAYRVFHKFTQMCGYF